MKKNWLFALTAATGLIAITNINVTAKTIKATANQQYKLTNLRDSIERQTDHLYVVQIGRVSWVKLHHTFSLWDDDYTRIDYLVKQFDNYYCIDDLSVEEQTGLATAIVLIYSDINLILYKEGAEFTITSNDTEPRAYIVDNWHKIIK